jgi:four helix bundle protein
MEPIMFGFEQLDVWQKAIEYADDVYGITRSFPADERFGLTNQLRRASVSVSSNIAEGSGRGSNRDFSRFLEIAYGSLMETVSQSTVAKRQQFCNNEEYQKLYCEAERIARMLSGLRNSLGSNSDPKR